MEQVKVNEDLKQAARNKGLPLWKLAQLAGISESTMTRHLRVPLPEGERLRLFELIERY